MNEHKKGFTNEDLMEVLKRQREVGQRYKSHFFTMFSQLFCTIAAEVIDEFGEEGRIVIANAVRRYGEERGKRIAKLVKSLGKPLDLKNFFIYGDLDGKKTLKYKPKIIDGNIEIVGRECLFCNGCKEWDMLEYGKIYCEHVDEAILRGYNPELKIQVPATLTKGDKRCILRYLPK